MPKLYVEKFDGRTQLYDREKVVKTLLSLGIPRRPAEAIADRVENKLYDGVSTRKILRLIHKYAGEINPSIHRRWDLRKAVCLLRPKPDFEEYVRLLLRESQYEVESNQIIRGRCVEHEIDATARKGEDVYYIEIKHHRSPHTYTGYTVFLKSQAILDDLIQGYRLKKHGVPVNKAMVVCNTKISDHAKLYSTCRRINYLCWKSPKNEGLEVLIEEKKLHPLTLLRDLRKRDLNLLLDAGFLTLKQVLNSDPNALARGSGLSRTDVQSLKEKAREILSD